MSSTPEGCCDPDNPVEMGSSAADELASLFALLADPIRLRIVSMMVGGHEVCACHLENSLEKSQPTISHHLSRLAAAGVMTGERRGRWIYWRLTPRFARSAPMLLNSALEPLAAHESA